MPTPIPNLRPDDLPDYAIIRIADDYRIRIQDVFSPADEQRIIGTVMQHPDYLWLTSDIRPNDFTDDLNSFLFYAIHELAEANETISMTAISHKTYSMKACANRGITREQIEQRLNMCGMMHVGVDDLSLSVSVVLESALRTRTFLALEQMLSALSNRTLSNHEAAIIASDWQYAIHKMEQKTGITDIETLAKRQQHNQQALMRGDRRDVIPIGDALFDSTFGGLLASKITILAGVTGKGKTTYMLDIALAAALSGKRTVIFVKETSEEEIWEKLLAKVMGIPYICFRKGLTKADYERMQATNQWLVNIPIHIIRCDLKPATIRMLYQQISMQYGDVDIVAIDGLWLMRDDQPRDSEWHDQPHILEKLKAMAGSSAILLTHQLDIDKVELSNEPKKSHLRGSQRIQQDVEAIFVLHTPDTLSPLRRLWCLKHRDGTYENQTQDLTFSIAGDSYFSWDDKISDYSNSDASLPF